MNIPTDPAILLSFVNTKLRDFYPSLEELCKSLQLNEAELTAKLEGLGCHYDPERNQFI